MVGKHPIHPLALFLGFALDADAICKKPTKGVSPSRAVPICRPHNNGNRTPTRCGGNTRPSPTRGEALHALAWSRRCARWSVATAPAQTPCTITKYNGKGLAARCARGVEGKGERLVPTYLGRCRPLGERNYNISPRCQQSSKGTPWGVSRCQNRNQT